MICHTGSMCKGAHLYGLSDVQLNSIFVWNISHKFGTYVGSPVVCGPNELPWSLKYNNHYQQQ